MTELRKQTHTLVIEVPISLDDATTFDYDPLHQALKIVCSVSRLAVDGVICGDVDVHLKAAKS